MVLLLFLQVLHAYEVALKQPPNRMKASHPIAADAALSLSKVIYHLIKRATIGPESAIRGHTVVTSPIMDPINQAAIQYLTEPPCQQLIINMLAAAVPYNKKQEQHHWLPWNADPSGTGYTRPGIKANGNILIDITAITMPDYHNDFYPKEGPVPAAQLKKYEGGPFGTWPATYKLLNTLHSMVMFAADGGNDICPTTGEYPCAAVCSASRCVFGLPPRAMPVLDFCRFSTHSPSIHGIHWKAS